MKGPEYGAIGATFKTVRMMQAICLIAIIGMTANFISEMVQSQQTPPSVLVGTLSVVSSILFIWYSLQLLINYPTDMHSGSLLRNHLCSPYGRQSPFPH